MERAGHSGPGLASAGPDATMLATLANRRTAATVPTLGTSPNAKRTTRRGAAAPEQGAPPQMSIEQVVVEVRTLLAQSRYDQLHFDETIDLLNNHAMCLDALRDASEQMRQDMLKIAEDVKKTTPS